VNERVGPQVRRECVDYKWNVSMFDFVWFPKENEYIFLNRNNLFIALLVLFSFLNFIFIYVTSHQNT
jgi:hypothetical protein